VKANTKTAALLSSEPPRKIFADNVAGMSSDAATCLFACQRSIQRARQRVRAPYAVCIEQYQTLPRLHFVNTIQPNLTLTIYSVVLTVISAAELSLVRLFTA
jgi:hypothetical protein